MIPATLVSIPPMTAKGLARIEALEKENAKLDQTPIATYHVFHAGLYARSIMLTAGTLMTGALIKRATILILNGDVTMAREDDLVRLTGYHVLTAAANRKQAFLAHADTHMTMLFPTEARDIETVEREFTDESDKLISKHGENIVTMTED